MVVRIMSTEPEGDTSAISTFRSSRAAGIGAVALREGIVDPIAAAGRGEGA